MRCLQYFSCLSSVYIIFSLQILPEEDYMKYLQLCINAAETRAPNSFHCKSVDCLGWCYYEDEVNWFTCNVCGKRNCLTCKAIHDNMSCQEYQDDLKRRARSEDAARKTQEMLEVYQL